MTTNNDIQGLMKFCDRPQWRERFSQVYGEHLGFALEDEAENEGLISLLGQDWYNNLWGCIFEDFLTQEFDEDGTNAIDEYLKRRGWKESATTKSYMKAMRMSVMSLYEVSDIVPGKSLKARDLIRGGEPIVVSEVSATKSLKQWDRMAARIVPKLNGHQFTGGMVLYSHTASDKLFDGLREVFCKKGVKKLPVIGDYELRSLGFLFTSTWLDDLIDNAAAPRTITNTDGDEFMVHDVQFPLALGVMAKDVAARVDLIAGMARENKTFWNWLDVDSKPKTRSNKGLILFSVMDNGLPVLGTIELKGRVLHLSVNSAQRARQGTQLLKDALGDLVRTPSTVIRTIDQIMAEQSSAENQDELHQASPEVTKQMMFEYLDRHYRETLDMPLGALGDKSARQLAKSAAGRQKVAEWLKFLENGNTKQSDANNPVSGYNFEWMWRDLGVLDLRQ